MTTTASPVLILSAIWFIDEYDLYAGTIDTINPACCFTAYVVYALTSTILAMLHSPAPP